MGVCYLDTWSKPRFSYYALNAAKSGNRNRESFPLHSDSFTVQTVIIRVG